ncbi:hypothetical protein PS3A_13170 [Pseudomonas sp. 3A(2025)]
MTAQRFRSLICGCLFTPLCMASPVQIDPRGESLYQQALPYLQQADKKLEAISVTPSASDEEKRHAQALAAEAGVQLKPAIALLEQAASLDHPVAQHRLGLIYVMFDSNEALNEKACRLFEKSLVQGFAPPALLISSMCHTITRTPRYQAALLAIESSMPAYEKYFPQPVLMLGCKHEEPPGFGMQWGSSRDYQAEIYRLLGDSNRKQRLTYYQKALDINDCYKVKISMSAYK